MPQSVPGTTVLTYDETSDGLALEATFAGGTPPTTADTFAEGAVLTNRNSGERWINVGSSASPSWDSQAEISNPGETVTTAAPALSTLGYSVIDSSSNAVDATLAAADTIGTIKVIVMSNADNSSTVTIANHQTSDPEVATFNAIDETGVFMWTGTEWITLFATCTFV